MRLPLDKYSVLHSHDADDICNQLSRKYCSHQLTPQSARIPLDTRYHRVSFGDVSFNYLHYGAEVHITSSPFSGFLMLEIPLAGTATIHYGDETIHSARGLASVVSSTQPLRSRWSADARRIMVQIDRGSLEHFTTTLLGRSLSRPIEFQLAMSLECGIGMGIASYVNYVINQLSNNDLFHQHLLVKQQVVRTIYTMLLSGQPHTYSQEINAIATPGAPRHIERAYQYIMEHFDQEIDIVQLTEISGISVRALYEGFKRYKGTSPMLALKNRRLEAAHQDLRCAGTEHNVTEIALRWGFSHLGNFARDYQRRFKEKPSETRQNALRNHG